MINDLNSAKPSIKGSIPLLFFVFIACSAFTFYNGKHAEERSPFVEITQTSSLNAKALAVLKNKCNDCHLKKNKSVIFDEKNMASNARRIHKMVFVKKKMPKEDVTLTAQESLDLKAWLKSLGYTF